MSEFLQHQSGHGFTPKERKIRLLRVISTVNPKAGGPIEGVKQLYPAMQKLGVELEVVCCDDKNAPWLSNCGLPVVHAIGRGYTSYSYSPALLNWLRENLCRFDVVIINGIWKYHGLAVRKALMGTNIPYFVFTHGMLDPWFRRAYPFKHFKKLLFWPWSDYKVLRDAHAVIFTSEEERLLARESFALYKANEVVTTYGTSSPPMNGIELSRIFKNKYSELEAKRIILFLSRIHEKKGCDLLINAFAQIANQDENLHLVIAGPDQDGWTLELKKKAAKLGIEHRITWTGMLEGDQKWGAYYASEIFCLPSHQENFGIVVAEALACGKPVLISDKVNIWREIENDKAGFIDKDTEEGTLNNLTRWLKLDSRSYAGMADKAKECFINRFHISAAASRLVDIINSSIR